MRLARLGTFLGILLVARIAIGQANTASLLDLTTNTVISNFVVGDDPQGVAWSGSNVAYVVNDSENTLVRLNMTTSPPTITSTFGLPPNFGPHAVAINPTGTRALLAGDGTSVYLVDLTTSPFTIVDTIAVVSDAGGLAFYAAGAKAVIANESNVLFLDLTTIPAVVTTVALGNQAHSVAVNSLGTRAAVSIDTGGLQVLDLTTSPPSLVGSVVGPNIADSLGLAISPDGTRAIYVDESTPASQANVVNITGTPSLVNSVPLTILSPSAVAFNPVSGAVLIAGDDGVSILNPPYTAVSATIPNPPARRGAGTYTLAINPAGTRALVLHEDPIFCSYPINFGNVPVGTPSPPFMETCTNTGTGNATVTSVTISGTGFTLANVPAFPVVLAPGGTLSFNIIFTPPVPGPQAGLLDITATYSAGTFDGQFDTAGNGIVGPTATPTATPTVTPTGPPPTATPTTGPGLAAVPTLSWPTLGFLALLLAGIGLFAVTRRL